MDDDYRVCSVCSALLTDDEVWADGSGSVVYTTSSLQTSLEGRVYPIGNSAVAMTSQMLTN